MVWHVAAVKRLSVSHHNADYIFYCFGIFRFILNYSENRVRPKPVLGGVASVTLVITGHKETPLNRVCRLHF